MTTTDDTNAARRGSESNDLLGPVPARWYVVDCRGVAMVCVDERDARSNCEDNDLAWPKGTPHRAVLLGDVAALAAENAALKREAHTWSKAAEHYAKPRAPLTREQIDAVMTEHYPLSSLLREEVDAFERCVRDLERLHGIGV